MSPFRKSYVTLRSLSAEFLHRVGEPHAEQYGTERRTMRETYEAISRHRDLTEYADLRREAGTILDAWREFVEFVGQVNDQAAELRSALPFAVRERGSYSHQQDSTPFPRQEREVYSEKSSLDLPRYIREN